MAYDKWHNNEVQFARLLREIVACGALEDQFIVDFITDSISLDEIDDLLDRADKVWATAMLDARQGE
jgi:hypothetical protein